MQIVPNSFGSPLREANPCNLPAGSEDGGRFGRKDDPRCGGAVSVPLDDALELVNTYTTWTDEDVLDALDSYGLEGRGETDAQRARRERYGEGEGQPTLPGDWERPAPGTAWKDLSVPERLAKLGVAFETIEPVAGSGASPVYVIEGKNGPLVLDEDGGHEPADEWVTDTDPADYVDLGDYNKEFWAHPPGETYHATPEENVEAILAEGLAPMNASRGLSNRGTGAAVFTSSEIEVIQDSYGPKVFRIDLDAMRADGYTPEVSEEEPIMERRAKEVLASMVGLTDFTWDVESGIDESTLIIFGHIPPKYLELLED